MADILYTYNDNVYVNLTNKCDCACRFCIRSHHDGVGDADTLWHKADPSLEEVKAAIDAYFDGRKASARPAGACVEGCPRVYDFSEKKELVYCGYGEPTCALENLIESARYAKEKYGLQIRVNTNGLGNLYHKKDIVPLLAEVVDTISISLNAPTKEAYMDVTRPRFADAFEGMLSFARECAEQIKSVKFTVVDVLSEEEIEASRRLAQEQGVELRVRKFV